MCNKFYTESEKILNKISIQVAEAQNLLSAIEGNLCDIADDFYGTSEEVI